MKNFDVPQHIYQRTLAKFGNFDEYRRWAMEWDKAKKKVKKYYDRNSKTDNPMVT